MSSSPSLGLKKNCPITKYTRKRGRYALGDLFVSFEPLLQEPLSPSYYCDFNLRKLRPEEFSDL